MEEILKLINGLDWSEGFYKAGFLVMGAIVLVAGYQGLKIFGKRTLAILDSLQTSVKELMNLSQKQDTRITLIEQEQKFQNEKLLKHDDRMEDMMKQLIQVSSR